MLGSIFESNNKIRNISSLFTFTYCLIFNIFLAFLDGKGYKKKFDIDFDEMSRNGKLDKVIKEALDESNNLFLKKNYPLLLEMHNNYINLDQCKDEYATKKMQRLCKFILSTLQTKQKVYFICFVAMHFLKELEL